MSFISFQYLDSLLTYLKACRGRVTELGKTGSRDAWAQVHLSIEAGQLYYQIPVPNSTEPATFGCDEPAGTEGYRADASIYDGHFNSTGKISDRSISANDLLRLIPLRIVPNIVKHMYSIMVVAPTMAYHTKDAARERLFKAWREIPRVAQGRSRFYSVDNRTETMADVTATAISWVVVHVEGVDPQFKVEAWLRRNPAPQLLLFVQPENNCDVPYLFVQWGYQYPNVEELSLLYDIGHEDHHLLIVAAGDPVALGALESTDPTDGWCESHWHDVSIPDSVRDHEPWSVLRSTEQHTHIMTVEPIADAILVPLELGDSHQVLGAIPDLVRQIHRAEHELAVLHAKRRRLSDMGAHREYFPVYLFKEDSERAGIPSDLQQFLGTPLSELDNYLYTAWASQGVTIHCVIGEVPVTLGTVLTVPCTHAYIQDTRWRTWRLLLFVQVGSVLTIDLEEQNMAERTRQMLEREGVPADAMVLAGPGGGEQGHLCLTVLPKANPLDQCLAYINGRNNDSAAVVVQAIATHLVSARQLEVDVSGDVSRTLSELKDVCQSRLAEAENRWEEIRQKVRFVALLASTGEQAISVTRTAYEEAPKEWRSFLEKLLALDASLAAGKDAAWAKYALEDAARQQRLGDLEQSYRNTIDELKASELHHQEVLAELLKLQEEIARGITRIQDLKGELRIALETTARDRQQLETEVSQEQQDDLALKVMLQSVAKQQRELNEAMEAVARDRQQLAANTKRLEEDRQKLKAEQNLLDVARAKYDGDIRLHQQARQTFAGEKTDVDATLAKLERDRNELAADQERLLNERRKLAEERVKLDANRLILLNDLREMENDRRELEKDRATASFIDGIAKATPSTTSRRVGRPVAVNGRTPGKTVSARLPVRPSVRQGQKKHQKGIPGMVARVAEAWRHIWRKGH